MPGPHPTERPATIPAAGGRLGGARALPMAFTLIEIVVVLVLLGLGAALVAPSLWVPSQPEGPSSLAGVIEHARAVALRRGETVVLRVAPDGAWDLYGASSAPQGALSSGHTDRGLPSSGFALRVSPFGSCGPTLESDAVVANLGLQPLTCRLTSP